jgi:hypothetical protein
MEADEVEERIRLAPLRAQVDIGDENRAMLEYLNSPCRLESSLLSDTKYPIDVPRLLRIDDSFVAR